MIPGLTILLGFQLVGEVLVRAAGWNVPGPVLGMALLALSLATMPRLVEVVRVPAQGLLSHLSLLFVPAGVGVVGHLELLGSDGAVLILAILVSTGLAMVVGAGTFVLVARLTGSADD